MEPVPQKKPWWYRLFNLLLPAYFLSSVVLDWNEAEWTWLGFMLLAGLATLLEAVWTASVHWSKRARIASTGLTVAAVVLFAAGGWREFVRPRATRGSVRSSAITAPITVTPLNGIRGQTLTVTVDSPNPIFTGQSRPDFGPGVKTVRSEMKSATTLVAVLEIAAETPPGQRRISVTTPERQTVVDDSSSGAFSVLIGSHPLR